MFTTETNKIINNFNDYKPTFNDNDITDNFAINYQKYPQPVTYGPIRIVKDTEYEFKVIKYTDCFEISLLRFLHLIFGNNGTVELNKVPNLQPNDELDFYFYENKTFYNDINYYETNIGFKERARWCDFLNERNIFKYKMENKYEVCASLENLFSFFSHFFNITFENKNYQDNLNKLANILSTDNLQIRFKLFNFGNKTSDSFYMNSYIKIFVNDDNLYDWEITQYFNVENDCITERVTGHSDYRNSTYINNLML